MRKILIFNEDPRETRQLGELLKAEDFTVFETARVLEAIRILKTEDIDVVLASQSLDGAESSQFRELVERTRPGVNFLLLGPFYNGARNLSVSPAGFRQFLQDSIRTETSLHGEIADLKQFCFSFADRLLQIFEVHDSYFFNNDHLVAELSGDIAARMGLEHELVDTIRMAALIKDLGMIGIQNQFLEDKKRFTKQELIPVKKHSLNTVELLKQLKFPWNIEPHITQHHEHYDGSGYPVGLKGRQISLGARIIAIADSYVAMTTDRPYRSALQRDEAVREITKKAGTQFDPEVVEAFLSVVKEVPAAAAKRSILMLERQPVISAVIRLSVDAEKADVLHASNSFDAIRLTRLRTPDLIIADVGMLDRDAFLNFYNTLQEIPSLRDRPFILILPEKTYPRRFKGKKLHYIEKPLDMGELSGAINRALEEEKAAAPPPEGVSGLTGRLEDFGIADILQILNLGRKTARVDIIRERTRGTIYLQNGNVIHASTGDLKGKEAFLHMMQWETGVFNIHHGQSTEEVNIKMDTVHLLLEAARVLDERGRRPL
jgi:response regulator RpfG family c-di-GMP phosphodiesterase